MDLYTILDLVGSNQLMPCPLDNVIVLNVVPCPFLVLGPHYDPHFTGDGDLMKMSHNVDMRQ